MPKRNIDVAASSIVLRTRAKGLLSKLAHDLEIRAEAFEADVELDDERFEAELRFVVRRLRVVGAVKKGRVDGSVLSSSDTLEIERRIREQVFERGDETVVVALKGDDARASAEVKAPRGRQSLDVRLDTRRDDDGRIRVAAELSLSLRKLGVKEVKGPLGAFKLDDAVETRVAIVVEPG